LRDQQPLAENHVELRYIRAMKRDEVISRLKEAEPALRERGVAALFLYGSHARDEARPDSDIDILVELSTGADLVLEAYMAPFHLLEDTFPETTVGYSTPDGLEAIYRPHILASALRVF